MKRVIDNLRAIWQKITAKVHITSAVQLVDEISALAGKAEAKAEDISGIVSTLPFTQAIKAEAQAVITAALPVLKILANEPQLKRMYDSVRTDLATIIADIISGKVHGADAIKADIQSLFTTVIDEAKAI